MRSGTALPGASDARLFLFLTNNRSNLLPGGSRPELPFGERRADGSVVAMLRNSRGAVGQLPQKTGN